MTRHYDDKKEWQHQRNLLRAIKKFNSYYLWLGHKLWENFAESLWSHRNPSGPNLYSRNEVKHWFTKCLVILPSYSWRNPRMIHNKDLEWFCGKFDTILSSMFNISMKTSIIFVWLMNLVLRFDMKNWRYCNSKNWFRIFSDHSEIFYGMYW